MGSEPGGWKGEKARASGVREDYMAQAIDRKEKGERLGGLGQVGNRGVI